MATITATIRVARDAELRSTASGTAVCEINAAENHRAKSRETGEWHDTGTTWWSVKAFGKLAEQLAETATRGTLLLVTGRSETREFEKRDGSKGTVLELIADQAAVIPRPPRPSFAEQQQARREIDGKDAYGRNLDTRPGGIHDPWASEPAF